MDVIVHTAKLVIRNLNRNKPRLNKKVKVRDELLTKAAYCKLLGKSVREMYVRWIRKGYWVLSPQCVYILTYLFYEGIATRTDIDGFLRSIGYAGFEYQAEALQRLLLFGAIRRDKLGQFTLYRLTPVGRKIIYRACSKRKSQSKYVPISTANPDMICVTW